MAFRIYIGDINNPTYYFEGTGIESCNFVLATSMSGDELAIDQLCTLRHTFGLNLFHLGALG